MYGLKNMLVINVHLLIGALKVGLLADTQPHTDWNIGRILDAFDARVYVFYTNNRTV